MDILPATTGSALVVPIYYVSIGIVVFSTIHSVFTALLGHKREVHLWFAASNICGGLFQFFSICYMQSATVSEAVTALKLQIASVCMFFPLFYCFVARYTQQRQIMPWAAIIGLFYSGLNFVNLSMPFGLRFESLHQAAPIQMSWGEQLSMFKGEFSPANTIFRFAVIAQIMWSFHRCSQLFQTGKKRTAIFLAFSLMTFVVSSIWGILIDAGQVKSVYIPGFTYLLFPVLMSVSLSYELRDRNRRIIETSERLSEEVSRREEIENSIRQIASSASSQIGPNYFRKLATVLAKLFDAENAKIAVLDEKDKSMTTLALLINNKLVENETYGIANWRLANVLEFGSFYTEADLTNSFPNSKNLKDLNIKSYLGVALKNSEGKNLGVISLFSSHPMHKASMAEEIIDIISARTVAEIERMRFEQQMRTMAYQDYLTGLANRASLQQHLNVAISKAQHMNMNGAMLIIDLDHFKTINDALSHDIGDEVLRCVGQRIKECTGEESFAARLGGDEFVVMLDPSMIDLTSLHNQALELANLITKALSSPIQIGEHSLNIGASVGIATYPNRGENSLDLLRHADMALYKAKSKGRSNVQFYEAPMQTAAYNRLLMEKGLRKALDANQMSLSFQPQVNADGDMTGAEVLLRWQHPKLGDVSPLSFIQLAEETGLIHSIGNWVLNQVCEQLTTWKKMGINFPGRLSVNVSPWQFTHSDFVQQVADTFASHGVNPAWVTLEITESALMYDIDEAIQKLNQLQNMGLSISLDDFGTGYSSLSYLKQLPLDELKIDQSFVRELTTNETHPLVESMVAIGQHMHLKVVAEGVENGLQRDRLLTMGCDHFQGYWYCQPLAEQAFQDWLKHTIKLYEPVAAV